METLERELDILQNISESAKQIHQRDLAEIIGLSLGMTNAILKRLVQKGWLKVKKINNRNIQYIVSRQGMEEIARRSFRYFKRTIKNVVYYKEVLDQFAREVRTKGFDTIVLVGESDLDFVIEHVCQKNKLSFKKVAGEREIDNKDGNHFVLYSEGINREPEEGKVAAFLYEILMTA